MVGGWGGVVLGVWTRSRCNHVVIQIGVRKHSKLRDVARVSVLHCVCKDAPIVNILPHSLTLPLHIHHIVTALAQQFASKPAGKGTLDPEYFLLSLENKNFHLCSPAMIKLRKYDVDTM